MADQAFEDNYVQALKASGKAPANFMAFRRPDGSVYYGTDEQNTGVVQSRIQNVTGTSDGTSAGATSGGVDDKGKSVQSAEDAAAAEERRRQGIPQGDGGGNAPGNIGEFNEQNGEHVATQDMSFADIMSAIDTNGIVGLTGIPFAGLSAIAQFDITKGLQNKYDLTDKQAKALYSDIAKNKSIEDGTELSDEVMDKVVTEDRNRRGAEITAGAKARAIANAPPVPNEDNDAQSDGGYPDFTAEISANPSSTGISDVEAINNPDFTNYDALAANVDNTGKYGGQLSTPNKGPQVPSISVDHGGPVSGTDGSSVGGHGAGNPSGDTSGSGSGASYGGFSADADATGGWLAAGGEVKGYAAGGGLPGLGMPGPSTQPVAQDITAPGGPLDDKGGMKAEQGSFVLNAAAVKALGMDKINQMVKEVTEKVGKPASSGPPGLGGEPKPHINISNGEVVFSRAAKEYFGTKMLDSLNGKGVEADPATAQKAEEKHKAEGGPPPAGLPEQTGNAQPSATGTLAMPQNTGATRDASAIPPGPLG